jgi:SpoVK/Ycf46/Vps4 family AAA+-type ATPase
MPTVAVRIDELAAETDGMSPADLKALCQEAALVAMARTSGNGNGAAAVTHGDFEEALGRLREGSLAQPVEL